MRYTSYSRLLALLLVLFIIGGAIWFAADPVRAALGNRGVPVRCYNVGTDSVEPSTSHFLTCTPADGSGSWSEGRVPEGYYFLVTDVHVAPQFGTIGSGTIYLTLFASYSESIRSYGISYYRPQVESISEHFTTPAMVLPEGYRIEAVNAFSSDATLDVTVSGLLVNNVTYVPLVAN
jgi:hypothetical protein